MDTILFKPKSKEELELLKTFGKKMGIKYSTLTRKEQEKIEKVNTINGGKTALKQMSQKVISKGSEDNSAFVPGNPAKLGKALKKVCGMWADREDMEDINEWRRKLWEREF